MSNVAEVDRTRGSDWPTLEQLAAFKQVRNTSYPPQGRTSIAGLRRRAG